MKRTVTAVKARQNLGELLDAVYHRDDRIVIERDGKPMAALVPMWILENHERAGRELFEFFREQWARNKDVDPAEIEAEVAAAIAEVRAEKSASSDNEAAG